MDLTEIACCSDVSREGKRHNYIVACGFGRSFEDGAVDGYGEDLGEQHWMGRAGCLFGLFGQVQWLRGLPCGGRVVLFQKQVLVGQKVGEIFRVGEKVHAALNHWAAGVRTGGETWTLVGGSKQPENPS